jgi:hypothetical protein
VPGFDLSGALFSLVGLWIIAGLVLWGLPAMWLADQKGRDPLAWVLLALFLGPIALLTVGMAPRGARGRYGRCPACRESIDLDAEVCAFCRTRFEREAVENMTADLREYANF